MVPVKILILGSQKTGKTGVKLQAHVCACVSVCVCVIISLKYVAASHGTLEFVLSGIYLYFFPSISPKIENKTQQH